MTIMKICAACKEASQWREPSYAHMTRAKKAGELFYTDIIEFISLIGYNRARFIVYSVDDVFRVHFEECMKEKEKASRVFRV